jgi:NADH:ubiquinone oxidoreductase subunit 2 (subunit N)
MAEGALLTTPHSGTAGLDSFVLGGFLFGYGLLIIALFIAFWRWSLLFSYQGLTTHLRQLRAAAWQRFSALVVLSFTGLPPFFFFFNKFGVIIHVTQVGGVGVSLFVIFFLLFGWYAYFSFIRWLSLTHTSVGYTHLLSRGFFSTRGVISLLLCGCFVFLLGFFMDDFLVFLWWFLA